MGKYYYLIVSLFICILTNATVAQDTFSIVAVDTISGEVGSAAASCVDMDNFPSYDDDFLGELFPGVGAINTQAWYLAANQANARERMNAGDMPQQIIDWLYNNDAQSNPEKRQYGIVRLDNNSSLSAAFTGNQTDDYKNHITGPNYSIQGNILKGPEVLDSMETRFLREEGDLACKLMAALQGAKMVGADSRCFSNGTSSLFSFVKVAQTDDVFGEPSFLLSVRTSSGEGIEPIDSLQVKFDLVKQCSTVSYTENKYHKFQVFPNPATDKLNITFKDELKSLKILNLQGQICMTGTETSEEPLSISGLKPGIYILELCGNDFVKRIKFIKSY
jgi:uncharacterized Ntn-hydrolase superfamily protein